MMATSALFIAFLYSDFKELDNTSTLGAILAGLGGFNYAAGRASGAYTQVRLKQAENGIPAPDIAPPTTTINVGKPDMPQPAVKKGKK
jgi:hypothetical protein